MNLTEAELMTLIVCTTVDGWNAACDAIKAARNGQYPPDWYERVMLSGVSAAAQRRFTSGGLQIR